MPTTGSRACVHVVCAIVQSSLSYPVIALLKWLPHVTCGVVFNNEQLRTNIYPSCVMPKIKFSTRRGRFSEASLYYQ